MAISFEITPEQEKLKEQAAEFAQREIAPIAAEIDQRDDSGMIRSLHQKMAQVPYGYTGMFIPEECEGSQRSVIDACVILEELVAIGTSAVCGAVIELDMLASGPIKLGGNKEQQKKYLPPIARGEGLVSFCLTEPGIGSDAAALRTRAELVGDEYVLNGRKRYASFAHLAGFNVVFAKTDPEKGARGVSAFVVPSGTPGFTVVERIPCLGMRGHQDEEITIENCRIPRENLIGEEGKGLRYALGSLDDSRITLTSGYIGLARAAMEEAVRFARARRAFGKEIAEFQAVSFPLTDVAIEIEAARLLTHKAAWLADNKVMHTAETAAAKAFTSQLLIKATNLAVEVHGGFGCTQRFSVERMFRDARIWVFAQGAPNIQRLIAMRALFERLEPSPNLIEEIAAKG